MGDPSEFDAKLARRLRFLVAIVALGGLIAFSVAVFRLFIWSFYNELFWVDLAKGHAAALLGLPLAAFASLGLVLLLESTTGRIEFEVAGLKFKGAAGPITFWILCFLAIAVAIKLTWV